MCSKTSFSTKEKKRIHYLTEGNLDFDYLESIAKKHGLRSLLYWNLKKLNLEIYNSQKLNEFFLENLQKNLLMMGELFKILKILSNSLNCTIPYKGPVLAYQTYGKIYLREFDDLDIYLPLKDVLIAKKLLEKHGYESLLNLNKKTQNQYLNSQRELKLYNPQKRVNLELQWNVTGASFSYNNNNNTYPIFDPIIIKINNIKIKTFKAEDLVLILSIHAAGHLWERLIWLCDLNELIKSSFFDWDIIITKARLLGVEKILYLNLYLLNKLMGFELPKNVNNKMMDDDIEKLGHKFIGNILSEKKQNILKMIILRYQLRENCFNGIRDIWKTLTIPSSIEWEEFEEKGNDGICYLIRRPIQIINRFRK